MTGVDTADVKWLELRIPPLLLTMLWGLAMWWLAFRFSTADYDFSPGKFLAVGLAVIALAVGITAILVFRQVGTTVNPIDPDQTCAMVTNGIYRYSRNPMYLGMLLLLMAWALWLSNLAALALLPGFVLYMNRFQIQPEERFLARKFGEDYQAYRASVRRWL